SNTSAKTITSASFSKAFIIIFASGDIFINTFRSIILLSILFNYTFLNLLYLLFLLILYYILLLFKLDCIIFLCFLTVFSSLSMSILYTLIFFDFSSSKNHDSKYPSSLLCIFSLLGYNKIAAFASLYLVK